jgi:hypothetical protein
MGYRSDLMAVFYAPKEHAPVLKLYVDENFPEQLKAYMKPIDNGRYAGYAFSGTGWKWYESYPEVIAFNQFVSNYLELADADSDEANERRWAYEFVRIGEDSDDNEETYSDHAHYLIQISRTIDSEFN